MSAEVPPPPRGGGGHGTKEIRPVLYIAVLTTTLRRSLFFSPPSTACAHVSLDEPLLPASSLTRYTRNTLAVRSRVGRLLPLWLFSLALAPE